MKTWFVLTTAFITAFTLVSGIHWLTIQPEWTQSLTNCLADMENRLENKCDSLRLYLLDQLDRLLPPEVDIEQMQTVEIDPAKHQCNITPSTDVPITRRVHVDKDVNCVLPISKWNGGLDEEGWLFVSRPAVELKEISADSPFS
jgi:hypothetical protein